MTCIYCGGHLAFVDGGDWAGFRCQSRRCRGWAEPQPDRTSDGSGS